MMITIRCLSLTSNIILRTNNPQDIQQNNNKSNNNLNNIIMKRFKSVKELDAYMQSRNYQEQETV